MSNAIIGQSGGPTAAINASLAGVFKGASSSDKIQNVYGCVNGIQGILNDNIIDLKEKIATDKDLEILVTTPSSYLGSCRYKLPKTFDDTTIFDQIFSIFEKYDIKFFFYIGGNDSMDTVYKLSEYAKIIKYDIQIIGVPKTVDNDLGSTDHTPGFGSAAKYVATCVKEICRDSNVYDVNSVTIVEIMGRNAGWLTAATALARCSNTAAPHLIYLPECNFSIERFIEDVKLVIKTNKNVIVCVSEGIKTADGQYVCESMSSGLTDAFGHKYLSGTAKVLEGIVRDKLGFKARGVEINVLQRAAGHFLSKTDIDESFAIGLAAVDAALNGETGKMMIFVRESSSPYKLSISSEDIAKTANTEKVVPKCYISAMENDVTAEFIGYARPLIIGEVELETVDGIPAHFVL